MINISKIKCFIEDQIDNLSKQTGYSYDFLVDMWNGCIKDDLDWSYFVGVTLERDW